MYTVGELVTYGALGVMRISDIREETVQDITRSYYILEQIKGDDGSKTYVPVDNERLVAAMRPLISADEAHSLCEKIKELPLLEISKDNRARTEKFRAVIESGDREAMLSMIKTVRAMAREREAVGKKGYISDTNMQNKAAKILYSELSYVLGVPESEMSAYLEPYFD